MSKKKGLMSMVYIPIFILLLLISLCQSDDQLIQTKPLLPKDTLISEGGDFALGFFSPTNSSKKLYIGIWYYGIAEHTVVWVANGDNPITTPSAKLVITDNSELVLSDSLGHTLWTTAARNTSGDGDGDGTAGASAVLLSSGNFVLRSSDGTEVWQSFDHPTNTILPTMRVLLGYKARLFSWKGPDDPSTGDISLGMDPTNLQMFIWKGAQPYFRYPVINDDVSVSGGMFQQSNGTAAAIMYYETRIKAGDELYYTYTVSPGSPYTRFSFDYTGTARFLSWNNTTSSWAAISEYPRSCDIYASCGPFSYCDRVGGTPTTCWCLDGFELLDSLNFSRGCRRKEELKCGTGNYFKTMPNMKIPDKFLHIKNRTFDQCADECTRNCSCIAYAYANLSSIGAMGDTSRCLVWNGDLIDMEKASFSEALYIRLGGSPVGRKSNLLKILLPIVACVLLLMLGALVWTCKSRGKRKKKRVQKRRMIEYLSSTDDAVNKNIDFPFISFENIVTATDNFSECNMVGKGGFGKVYKGMLEGTKEVAVKRLSTGSGQGKEEFKNEVVLIAKLQHKNLVKLLGCCIYEDEKLLVYEYLPNKSLDYFLFASTRKSMLQWPTRFKIIQGVARGIMYLHHDSRLTVIHRDIKASNILLDKEMNPKISDFGMARIFCGDQLQANTNRIVGTYGYMSPEYAMKGAFSVKSDTYSFGILMLEILSGLKISSPHLIMDFSNLITFAWNTWKDGKMEDFFDSSITESCSLDEVSRCNHIGLLCVQDNPNCRPLMSTVVFMLENKATLLPTPKQPIHFALQDYKPENEDDHKELSVNDLSLTMPEGR